MPIVRHKIVLADNIWGILDPAIRRLAYRAGIPIIGGDVYDKIRDSLGEYLDEILRVACVYMVNAKRKTIMVSDIVAALEHLGYKPAHAEK